GSRSFAVHASGGESTSTEYFKSANSSARTGENLGSQVAELIAFRMISSARVSFMGSIVPMQPRSSPSRVLIETKQPARTASKSETSVGRLMIFPAVDT